MNMLLQQMTHDEEVEDLGDLDSTLPEASRVELAKTPRQPLRRWVRTPQRQWSNQLPKTPRRRPGLRRWRNRV